jgi:hypothetical protein
MILSFAERSSVDVDNIVAIRWFDEQNKGLIIFNGERMVVEEDEFKIIEKAYYWLHKDHMYDKDLKRGK